MFGSAGASHDHTGRPFADGTVSFSGVTKSVSLAMVPEAQVGDYVIVHVGFAISKLDEEAARRTLEMQSWGSDPDRGFQHELISSGTDSLYRF